MPMLTGVVVRPWVRDGDDLAARLLRGGLRGAAIRQRASAAIAMYCAMQRSSHGESPSNPRLGRA